jgi:hypothetical protein
MTIVSAMLGFRVFPAHWDWRRVLEFGVASYQAAVGVVAFVHPQTLLHSSYAALLDMFSPQVWGLNLWAVALMHAACIAVNGRHPLYSGISRTIACTLHLGVMLLIGLAYWKVGDFYRLVTTGYLTLGVLCALSIATEDIARALNRRRVLADERRWLGDGNDGVA